MTKEVKIGLIGIAALAMLIFGINYLKGINMFQSPCILNNLGVILEKQDKTEC